MISALAASLRNRYRRSFEKRTASLDPQTRENLARDVHSSTVLDVAELQELDVAIEQAQLSLQELEEKRHFVVIRLSAYQKKLDQRAKTLRRERERLGGLSTTASDEIVDQTATNSKVGEETRPLSISRADTSDSTSPGLIDNAGEDDEKEDIHIDEEAGEAFLSIDELEKQELHLQKDQLILEKIEKSQKDMEANARELQKRIFVLERKRDEILQKTGECRDFLVAAAQIEREQEAEDDSTVESHEDLEEGQVVDDVSAENELVVLLGETGTESIVQEEGHEKVGNKAE